MILGKCAKKNWNWKPIQQGGQLFLEKSTTGTIIAQIDVIDEVNPRVVQELQALSFHHPLKVQTATSSSCTIILKGSRDKRIDIENYARLKTQIEVLFPNANRAIIAVKKSASQINIIHCGQKS